ncbi:MAG TPA: RNA methyltransferase [Ignavibacteria bacterium]|nr:RNA methyltransferase [Ignavibacteria bacterium]
MTGNELKYFSKLKQKKYRELESKFLIEGEHLISECFRSKIYRPNLKKIIIREDYSNDSMLNNLQGGSSDIEIISLTERNFNQLSDTVNPQGIIGVVEKSVSEFTHSPYSKKFVVALDSVNDPGNLGTIIRTCYWFGIDEILIGADSADLYNSKVIRSSQGALFHVNIREKSDLINKLKLFYDAEYSIILTDVKANKYLDEIIPESEKKYLIVFGNEANGIRNEILENKNYDKIKIRDFSECESLNISVSAGIVLNAFKTVKQ